MTLPANDAFTLGLAHDETGRRPHQSRSNTLPRRRSPSPQISFSSSKSTITATHTSRVERGLARRASDRTSSNRHKKGSGAVGDNLHNSLTKAAQPPLQEIEEKREDGPTPSPPSPPSQKVDWEIPRKMLHSSIGATAANSPSQPQLTQTASRISHFVLVLFKRILQASRRQSRDCTCDFNRTGGYNPSALSAI